MPFMQQHTQLPCIPRQSGYCVGRQKSPSQSVEKKPFRCNECKSSGTGCLFRDQVGSHQELLAIDGAWR